VGQHPLARGKRGAQRRGRAVAGAHRHAFQRVREPSASLPVKRPAPTPAPPQGMCVDNGEDDAEGRDVRAAFGFTAHLRARGEEAQALTPDTGFRARRWVVARRQRWMNRCRRVRIRWDKTGRNYWGVLHLAWAYITSRPSGLLG
jgi:putative transposase